MFAAVRSVSTEYAAYFATLTLPTSASKAEVRSSYLEQVAKLDAGRLDHGGAEQFAKIDVAFKGLLVKFEELGLVLELLMDPSES